MVRGQAGTILRHVRQLLGTHPAKHLTDVELLRRFAAGREETAFTELMQRHGRLVRAVCRHVLRHEQDAEDAFQATFLVLARKAAAIHKGESVASWLYAVASRVAMRARRTLANRRDQQRPGDDPASASPLSEITLRELQAVVDDELTRLPEKYRAPFVACCLEGKSKAEAAQELGWKEGTVSSRLAHARKTLQQRLTRRGLTLSSVLCVFALSGVSAAAVPALARSSTVKALLGYEAGQAAALGAISAEVAALAEGVIKTMFAVKLKLATGILLAVGLLAAAGALMHQAWAGQAPAAKAGPASTFPKPAAHEGTRKRPPAAVKKNDADTALVMGRVLGPGDKPFAGAKLYLASPGSKELQVRQRATSGEDGRFRFSVGKAEMARSAAAKPGERTHVLASAPDHGLDWVMFDDSGSVKGLTLRLVKDVPVRGQILDPDGRPVAGAKVRVTGVSTPRGDLGDYLRAVRKKAGYAFAKDWSGPLPGRPAVLTTGPDGRFKLAGVGRERLVRLHVEGPAIATADLQVMTRPAKKIGNLYGASFDYVAVASRPIRGVVRNKLTRRPLAGVSVGIGGEGRVHFFEPRWMTVTDNQGRYELLGLAKAPTYDLALKPTQGQLYFHRRAQFRDTRGLAPLTADIDMVQGLILRGKVTDKATGKPIRGGRLAYLPLAPNPNVDKLFAGAWEPHSESTTGPDGTYTITVLPGPGVLVVAAPKPDVYMPGALTEKQIKDFFKLPARVPFMVYNLIDHPNALVLLGPGPNDKDLVKDVALERPHQRKGRVVGPDGKPLSGVTVTGLGRWYDVETLKGAEFTVRGLNPRAGRSLIFYHKGKDLGFFLKQLPPEKAGLFTVRLQPCGSVSGRIVDQDGLPLAGVRTSGGAAGDGWISLEVTTDKNGRFHAKGLVPGLGYWIMRPNVVATLLVQFVAEPGKHKDLSDLKIDK